MTGQLILWTHALVALVCGALAIDRFAQPRSGWITPAFVIALFVTSFWALAVAGIDPRNLSVQLAEALRDLSWLALLYLLVRRDRLETPPLLSVYVAVAALILIAATLRLLESVPLPASVLTDVEQVRLILRMIATLGALVLVHQLHEGVRGTPRSGARLVAVALGAMWGGDLLLLVIGYAQADADAYLVLRGFWMIAVGLAFVVAAERPHGSSFALSRTVTVRTLSGLAAMLYIGCTIVLTMVAEQVAGAQARIVQTAVVLGSAVALLTLLSSPWLRAWSRVKLAKHLFRHRYDYRLVWQRFTATLGRPDGGVGLDARVVRAVAELTDSPAGLLLVPDGAALGAAAAWNWDVRAAIGEAGFIRLQTGRILEIDPIRSGGAEPEDAHAVPADLLAEREAWAIVPLVHLDALVGAILLARPPVDRSLDWEDFDLLRVAGRQAASYLAEQRAQVALAEARRFDEFNRRFAFILHDVKNLVSQLTLVARNAERHADNPAFRADMVATLKDSADRMNALLARLSQRNAAPAEPLQAVDAAAMMARVAARAGTHAVLWHSDGAPRVHAQPQRLEQVLGHLVQNACEASPPERPVTLSACAQGATIQFRIEDRGSGMSTAFVRDELFRPFASSKAAGFGIGAYEAKQLVHQMEGTISVTSKEGEGTTFLVTLPAARALETAA